MTARTPITVAQAIYDEPRYLERHEQVFLAAVHRIQNHCARTKGEAARAWGDGSRAATATADLANRQCAADLAAALAAYDAAREAMADA